MASFFDRFKGRKEPTSAEIAKERLKLVLVTDRSNLSPEKLEEMQHEIINVIKRYIPINEMEVQLNIEQRERKHYLVADVPLNRDPSYGALEAADPSHLDKTQPAAAQRDNTRDAATGDSTGEEAPTGDAETSDTPADADEQTGESSA